MTKFSEFLLGLIMFIGLALVFIGMLVASDTMAPNLMLFALGCALMGIALIITGIFAK